MKLRRLRDVDVLEDGDIVLVRGGDLDPDILSEDAVRYHSIYGVYGISVFAVRDATIDELAQQAPLVRFDRLSLLTVRDVLAMGMRLEPTGRNPRHFTSGGTLMDARIDLVADLNDEDDEGTRLVHAERRQ
jgi:hypothetical protein